MSTGKRQPGPPQPPAKRKKAPPGGPTARQRAFLLAVVELTELQGRAPSATELGARLGMTRLGARGNLQRLAAKGLIRDVPKVVSSGQWALTDAGAMLLELEED